MIETNLRFSSFFSGGISSTVRKCVHRETGITYAAKFSSRLRSNGYAMVDSTIEILHEIAIQAVVICFALKPHHVIWKQHCVASPIC